MIHFLDFYFLLSFKLHHVNFVYLIVIVYIHSSCVPHYNQEREQAVVGRVVHDVTGLLVSQRITGIPAASRHAICRMSARAVSDLLLLLQLTVKYTLIVCTHFNLSMMHYVASSRVHVLHSQICGTHFFHEYIHTRALVGRDHTFSQDYKNNIPPSSLPSYDWWPQTWYMHKNDFVTLHPSVSLSQNSREWTPQIEKMETHITWWSSA